jgi:hypothetical protein
MSSLNTDLIFPLSGETVFCPIGVTTTTTVQNVGILYLTGLFNDNNDYVSVTLNSKTIIFNAKYYTSVDSLNAGQHPGVVNLLSFDNVIGGGDAGTKNNNALTVAASDKNMGCYLPVKQGDIIGVNPSGCYAIVSLLYLT